MWKTADSFNFNSIVIIITSSMYSEKMSCTFFSGDSKIVNCNHWGCTNKFGATVMSTNIIIILRKEKVKSAPPLS